MRVILNYDPETGLGVDPYSRRGAKSIKDGYSFYVEARIPRDLYNRYIAAVAALDAVRVELDKYGHGSAPIKEVR